MTVKRKRVMKKLNGWLIRNRKVKKLIEIDCFTYNSGKEKIFYVLIKTFFVDTEKRWKKAKEIAKEIVAKNVSEKRHQRNVDLTVQSMLYMKYFNKDISQ
jgi:hypothetical protein